VDIEYLAFEHNDVNKSKKAKGKDLKSNDEDKKSSLPEDDMPSRDYGFNDTEETARLRFLAKNDDNSTDDHDEKDKKNKTEKIKKKGEYNDTEGGSVVFG
jgi:hypothetical protein